MNSIEVSPSQNPLEVEHFITTKRQLEEVFLPASRPDTPGKRSPYVTLFAVRHSRDLDFDSARRRSLQTGKNRIFIEYAAPDEAIIVGYYAKNIKDLHTYEERVGTKQKEYYAQRGITIVAFNED